MPTCTVAKKRSGCSARSRACLAPACLMSISCCRRLRRAETIAISAAEKKPFAKIKIKITAISMKSVLDIDLLFLMGLQHGFLCDDTSCYSITFMPHRNYVQYDYARGKGDISLLLV